MHFLFRDRRTDRQTRSILQRNNNSGAARRNKSISIKIEKKNYLELWGNGKTRRELIHVDDLSEAIVYFLDKKLSKNLINIGSGIEKTISQYAKLVCEIIGVKLKIKYKDKSLIGTPRKLLDTSFAKNQGWKSKTNLKKDILKTYDHFLSEFHSKK